MTIVEQSTRVLLELGTAPVLYLMVGLSIVSVAIMLERGWYFVRTRENLARLARHLDECLARRDFAGASALAADSRSVEASIVRAGLHHSARGAEAAAEAMASATALGRLRLEKRLNFLGTLGNNAPFVGLLGTVIGIVQAFQQLEQSGLSGSASTDIMGAIAEALVATAIGLAVAIPAVTGYNYFQRRIKVTLSNAEALEHVVLSHLKGSSTAEPPSEPEPNPRVRLSLTGTAPAVSRAL
jgi:biopolymer transport protein ExbB